MITLPDPDFTEEEIQAVLHKLAVAIKLLESVCAIKDVVKKLKNHPIHHYTLFLSDWHSPNSVDKYYCQNLNGRNANAKSQIHS
jgi:hypothetical protein